VNSNCLVEAVVGFRLASYKGKLSRHNCMNTADSHLDTYKKASILLNHIYYTVDGNVTVVPPYDCVHVSDRAKEIVKVLCRILYCGICGLICMYTFTLHICL